MNLLEICKAVKHIPEDCVLECVIEEIEEYKQKENPTKEDKNYLKSALIAFYAKTIADEYSEEKLDEFENQSKLINTLTNSFKDN